MKLDFTGPASAGNPAARAGAIFCGTDNLRGLSQAHRQVAHTALAAVVARHGTDPCTRQQVAAHEAGHVLVAWALGQRLKSTRIDPCRGARGAWIGLTHTFLPGRDPKLRTTAADDPSYAFRCAVDAMAGICGEIFAGLDHPSSSIDEQFKAAATARDLSVVSKLPAQEVMSAAVRLCYQALTANHIPFDVIRAQLSARRRLTGVCVAGVLARVTPLEWNVCALAALGGSGWEDLEAMPPRYEALVARAMALGRGT